jgi:hypothetical protein
MNLGTWTQWLNGVIGGFIGAAANSITVIIVDPEKFSPNVAGGWKHLGISILVSGGVGAALYLKQHPTPIDSTSVAVSTTTQPGQAPTTTTTVSTTHAEPKP